MPRKRAGKKPRQQKVTKYVDPVTPRFLRTNMESELRTEIKKIFEACGLSSKADKDKDKGSKTTETETKVKYWASGTGYGNDSEGSSAEWNVSAYLDAQSKHSDLVETSLSKIKVQLEKDLAHVKSLDKTTEQDIEKKLLPIFEFYLHEVSFLDLENFTDRYISLFNIIELLSQRPQFQPLLISQKDRPKSTYNLIKALKAQTKLLRKGTDQKEVESTEDEFSKQVNNLWKVLKDIEKRAKLNAKTVVVVSTPTVVSPTDSLLSPSSIHSETSISNGEEVTSSDPSLPLSLPQRLWKLVTYPCTCCLKKKKKQAKQDGEILKKLETFSQQNGHTTATTNTSTTENSTTSKDTSTSKPVSEPVPSEPILIPSEPILTKDDSKTKKDNKKTNEKKKTDETKTDDAKKKSEKKQSKKEKKQQQKDNGEKVEENKEKEKEEKEIKKLIIPEETKEETRELEAKYIELFQKHRFQFIKDFNEHHYITSATGVSNSTKFMRRLQSEYIDLSKSLPVHLDASIFVRAKESNMSLAQMMIMPASGPYQRGAFLFDIHFPPEYPDVPPHVNLQTTGRTTFRFNPNLYNCGKVCLSLLGTWHGRAGEGWQAGISTCLQVAVSVMSQIFVEEPFFNEPGEEYNMHTPEGTRLSDEYNSNVRNATIKFAMIEQIENPPVGFEYVTLNHFYMNKNRILRQIQSWVDDGLAKKQTTYPHLAEELPTIVEKLTKLLTELKKPEPPKDEEEDDDDDDDDDE